MELWGCGFNQFFQIDDSGDDVHELTRIDSVPASSESNSRIEIYWAGWADLICNHCLSTELILEICAARVEQKPYASVDSRLRKLKKRFCRG